MRPYLDGAHSSGLTTLSVKKCPEYTTILYVGEVFRVGEDATEYTVTVSDVTTNGDGEATITCTPGLVADYAGNTSLQIPTPRLLSDAMMEKIALQSSGVIYFVQFDFDDIYRIENIEDLIAGISIKITKTAHGLLTGDVITLDLPTEYAGARGTEYSIVKIDNNSFFITAAFDADAMTEGTYDVKSPVRLTTSPHDITWNGETWTGIGGILHFNTVVESRDVKGSGVDFKFSGVDPTVPSLLLGKAYAARPMTMWLGHINSDGTIECSDDTDRVFRGNLLSNFEITTSYGNQGKTGTVDISFRLESGLTITDTASGMQTNVDSHQQYYPDARLFDQIPKLINKPIKWGKIKIDKPKGGCMLITALSASMLYSVANDSLILQPLRDYRDNKTESFIGKHYKEISPEIIYFVEKKPCKMFVYHWIADKTLLLSNLIKIGKYTQAELVYGHMIKILEKFIA